MSAFSSTASTSWPRRTSDRATDVPKRPSPTTRTGWVEDAPLSANDRLLLGKVVARRSPPEYECRCRRNRADSSDEHQDYEDELGSGMEIGSDAGGEPDRRERRRDLEQHRVEVVVRHEHDHERRHRDEHDG